MIYEIAFNMFENKTILKSITPNNCLLKPVCKLSTLFTI